MTGRGVHEAGTGVVGDVIAGEQRNGEVVAGLPRSGCGGDQALSVAIRTIDRSLSNAVYARWP